MYRIHEKVRSSSAIIKSFAYLPIENFINDLLSDDSQVENHYYAQKKQLLHLRAQLLNRIYQLKITVMIF